MPEPQVGTKLGMKFPEGRTGATDAPTDTSGKALPVMTPGLEALSASANEFGIQVDMDTFDDLVDSTFGDNLPPDVLDMKAKVDASREAALKAGEAARGRTNESQFEVLEDALRLRGGIGAQKIGTSEIFQKAGLTGFENLSQSMNARLGEMTTRYDQFSNSLRSAQRDVNIKNQQLLDTYSNSLDEYNLLRGEYEFDIQRIDEREARIKEMEHDFALIDRKFAVDKELVEFEAKFEGRESTGDLLTDSLLSFDSGGLPGEYKSVNSFLGKGQVSGYGSPAWEHGLDFVLDGSKKAPIRMPQAGEIISVETGHRAGEEKSFGNQVKVRFGDQEVWFSHLDKVADMKAGDTFNTGAIIGTQGNTGTTLSTRGTPRDDNDFGTHVDITMPKPGGGFYSAREVAQFMGLGQTSNFSKESLEELDRLFERNDVDQKKRNLYFQRFREGMSMEEIESLITEKIPASESELKRNELNVFLRGIEQGTHDVDLVVKKLKETGRFNNEEIFDYLRENVSSESRGKIWEEEIVNDLMEVFISNELQRPLVEALLSGKGAIKEAASLKTIKQSQNPEDAIRFLVKNIAQGRLGKIDFGIKLDKKQIEAFRGLERSYLKKYPAQKAQTAQLLNLLFSPELTAGAKVVPGALAFGQDILAAPGNIVEGVINTVK